MCLEERCWLVVAVSQPFVAVLEPVAVAVLGVSDREEQRKPVGTPGGA